MAITFLTLALLATVQVQGKSAEKCALDGAGAVDHVADAAIFIWSATKRCAKGSAEADPVQCEIDITSAAQAVGDMADGIVGAASECGAIDTKNSACGRSVGQFLSATSGLAAAVGEVMADCPNKFKSSGGAILDDTTTLGKCVIDVKNSLRGVFEIMQGLNKVSGDEDKEVSAPGVFTDFGSFVAGSVNDCSAYKGSGNDAAACAAASLDLISHLDRVGELGEELAKTCAAPGSRLYIDEPIGNAAGSSPATLALAAFLPVTAVLSFIVGVRVAKSRSKREGLVQDPENIE